jgi:hypothetical protein
LDFTPGAGTLEVALVPRCLRVETDGVVDLLPLNTFVDIRFQAARDNGSGGPDESNPVVDFTGDIAQFNGAAAGEIRFFRFEVEFDLTGGGALPLSGDTKPVSLDFLRIPFLF